MTTKSELEKEFALALEKDADTPPSKQKKKLPWSPVLAVVFVVVLYFLAQIVGGLVVSMYPALKDWPQGQASDWLQNSIGAQFSYMMLVDGLMIGGLWWFLRRYKSNFRWLGFKRPRLLDPLLSAGGFVVYFVAYIILVAVLSHLVPALNVDQQQDIGFSNATGFVPLGMAFISLVILPPLAEEAVMRGFLFGSLRRKISFVWAAIITSVIFASGHLLGGGQGAPLLWIAFIDTFVLSIVLCYLREKTGRLWASIGLHMIKNGIAFITLFLLHVR